MSAALGPAGDLPGEPSCAAAPRRGVNVLDVEPKVGPGPGAATTPVLVRRLMSNPRRAPVALVRLDDELLAVLVEAVGGYRRVLLAAGRSLPPSLEPFLRQLILCVRRRQGVVLREPVTDGEPVALLDLDQAASLSRVSRRTLERRIAAGELRVRRSGRRVLLHPDDLAAHLDPGPTAA